MCCTKIMLCRAGRRQLFQCSQSPCSSFMADTRNNSMPEARAVALSQESDHHAFVVASHSTSVTAIDISDPAGMFAKRSE